MNFKSMEYLAYLRSSFPICLTENEVRIEIQTSIEGPLSFATTSPKLSASKIQAQVIFDGAPQVQASVKACSLEVISENISKFERQKILKAISDKILKIDQFPEIYFSSNVASIRDTCHPFSVVAMGELTINGVSREIDMVFKHTQERLISRINILQSDFQISPLTTLGGALRCKDRLDISIQILLDRLKNKNAP